MSRFTYSGEDSRYYPALGLTATPGLIAEFDDTPPADGRWIPTPVPDAPTKEESQND